MGTFIHCKLVAKVTRKTSTPFSILIEFINVKCKNLKTIFNYQNIQLYQRNSLNGYFVLLSFNLETFIHQIRYPAA